MWLCSSGGPARQTQSRSSGEGWRGWDCLGLAIVRGKQARERDWWRRRLPQQEGTVRKEEGKPARNLGFERRVVEEDGLRAGERQEHAKKWLLDLAMKEPRDLRERISPGVWLGREVGGGAQRQAAVGNWEGRARQLPHGKVAPRGHRAQGMSCEHLPGGL